MTESTEQPWTVLRLLEWTTKFFKERGSGSPRLDAEVLLAHVRGSERIGLYTAFGEVPDEAQRASFRELVRRRGEGTPVAYLVGYREFYSLRLKVNEHVLIPRPETEHVVVEALDAAKQLGINDRPIDVADVGTGSGAIAIAIAKHLPNSNVTAVDLSLEALAVATANAEQHEVISSIRLLQSDLLDAVETSARFDLICSNPPYVSESEYQELSAGVRDHEPRTALVAGPKGTEIIQKLVVQASERLHPDGRLIVELSPMIAKDCLAMVSNNHRWTDARLIKDLDNHHRVLTATKAS